MLKVKKSPVLLLVISLIVVSCSSVKQSEIISSEPMLKEELIEDLNYLSRAVNEAHPIVLNPTWSNKLDSFTNTIKQVEGKEVSVFEYDNAIREATSLIGCIHTAVMKSPYQDALTEKVAEMGHFYFFPLRLFVDSSDLYIIDVESNNLDSTVHFPFRVDSINGVSSQEIIHSISVHYPQDGYQKTFAHNLMNHYGAYSLKRHFYDVNTLAIKGKSEAGKELEIDLDAVQQYDTKSIKHFQPEGNPIVKEKEVSLFDIDDKSAYLKLESVLYEEYTTLHQSIFDHLNASNKKNLIIDLRGNTGGSQRVYLDLLSHLSSDTFRIEMVKRDESESAFFGSKRRKSKPSKKFYNRSEKIKAGTKYFINPILPKTTIFKGNLYVLVDGMTASGGSQLASFLKHKLNAVCLGQETGGGETGNNGHGYDQLVLPNSKISIKWPQYNVILDLPIPINLRGIKPNYEIKYDLKSYSLNRDLEMEKVFELIGN